MKPRKLFLLITLTLFPVLNAVKAPNGEEFPSHWGDPPLRQTKDLRPLPGSFGRGSFGNPEAWKRQLWPRCKTFKKSLENYKSLVFQQTNFFIIESVYNI